MMFAQSLLEYGAVSNFTTAMRSLMAWLRDGIAEVPQSTWATIGGVALLLFLLFSRRSR